MADDQQTMDLVRTLRGERLAARLSVAVLFGLAYLALSRAGLAFIAEEHAVAVLWPASGLALAVFATARPQRRPELIAATALGGLVAQLWARDALDAALALTAANVAEPLLGAWVVRRVIGPRRFAETTTRVVAGLVGAATVANAATALLGAAATAAFLDAPLEAAWLAWWLSDGLGILTLAPLLIQLATEGRRPLAWRAAAPVAAAVACAAVVFAAHSADDVVWGPYLLLPVLLAVAVFAGPHATSASLLLVAAIGTAATLTDTGPFVSHHLDHLGELQALQAFLAAAAVSTLMVSAVVHERWQAARRANEQSRRIAETLAAELAAQREREASERRYRQLAASLPESIVSLYDGDLRCVTVDGPLLERWRLSREETVGRPLLELLPPERVDLVLPICERALAGEPGSTEWVSARGPDTVYRFEAVPFRGEGGAIEGVYVVMRDVTAQRQADLAVTQAEADLRTIFDRAPLAGAIVTADLRVLRGNLALEQLTGYRVEDLPDLHAVVHPDDMAGLSATVAAVTDGARAEGSLDARLLHADGRTLVAALEMVPLPATDDGARALVQLVDATARARHEARLRHLAEHDPLTGLMNRRAFDAALARHLAWVERDGPTGALLMLDIDRFKQVNDTFGHGAGDALIAAVAAAFRRRLRATDAVARLGGDEFAVLLPHAGREDAARIAQELAEEARRASAGAIGADAPGITLSVGVAMFADEAAPSAERMLRNADAALYGAKDAGRDGFAFFASV